MLTHFLGAGDERRWRKIATYLRRQQRPDGAWAIYHDGPPDLNATVEAYFALKMAGVSAQEPAMRKARQFVLSAGGVPKVRNFTKVWLALFGQWDWRGVPVLPPELILLPHWFPLNIYDFASWARPTIVPMLVLLTERPVCPIAESARIDELYPVSRDRTDYSLSRPREVLSWKRFFHTADGLLRRYERMAFLPLRRAAYKAAEDWIVAHQEADGSWGGIQPPWVYSLLALKVLGYPLDRPGDAPGVGGAPGGLRGRGRGDLQPAGLSFAGVGYGPGHDRPPRFWLGAGPPGCGAGRPLAAAGAGADRGRLAGQGQGRRTGRLGLRVRERSLSGYGRRG